MHSRAAILIEKELFDIEKSRLKSIQVVQSFEKNKFQWSVKIKGPPMTLWEDGLFKLAVVFDESYNYKPPAVIFITIPFHPNVDPMTGRLSIDCLDDPEKWNCDVKMKYVLQAVCEALGNPQLEFTINHEAEDLYIHNRQIYNQLVKECVMVSRSIDEVIYTKPGNIHDNVGPSATILEYDDAFVDNINAKESEKKIINNVARINFEEYYSTWSGIATSKPSPESKNPHLQAIEGQQSLLSVHHGVKFEEIEDHLTRQLEQHKSFVYGNFTKDKNPQITPDDKIIRIEQMRKIYLAQKTPSNLSRRDWTRMSNIDQPETIFQYQDSKPQHEASETAEVQPQNEAGETADVQPQYEANETSEAQMEQNLQVKTSELQGGNVEISGTKSDDLPIPDHESLLPPLLNREETTIDDKEVEELGKWVNELDSELVTA